MAEQENAVEQKEAAESKTNWFQTLQTESQIVINGKSESAKLVVIHQCGDNKEELINQLKSLIKGIETDFKYFKG